MMPSLQKAWRNKDTEYAKYENLTFILLGEVYYLRPLTCYGRGRRRQPLVASSRAPEPGKKHIVIT